MIYEESLQGISCLEQTSTFYVRQEYIFISIDYLSNGTYAVLLKFAL